MSIALFLLLALKYALSQDDVDVVGGEPYEDATDYIVGLMIAAPILGSIFGVIRVLTQRVLRPILQPIRLS